MDIKKIILKRIEKKGSLKVSDIVEITGFSRIYIYKKFKELRREGKIKLIGKANNARYVSADEKIKKPLKVHRILKNEDLREDTVYQQIRKNSSVFKEASKKVETIFEYSFTEMLNNAIEHSQSPKIDLWIYTNNNRLVFEIDDKGVGIFNNIKRNFNLGSRQDAASHLLKGKQTTAPEGHSGEGIFFTSKVADLFIIKSSEIKLIFDNQLDDIFKKTVKEKKGTKIKFEVEKNSDKKLINIFKKYQEKNKYDFNKTEIFIPLIESRKKYISRSHAKRLLVGLENFKEIILDFKGVETVGQAFADEIYRVWKKQNPDKKIIVKNAGSDVKFMLNRAINKEF